MKLKIFMVAATIALIVLVVVVSFTSENGENIDDITFEPGVVNIYYFWQEGCPHCDAQFSFFESIEAEFGAYFNVYSFEVASNPENARLLYEVSTLLNITVSGVPFTIIGDQTFTGFNNRMEDDFISAITDTQNQEFDVFRDLME